MAEIAIAAQVLGTVVSAMGSMQAGKATTFKVVSHAASAP
jgi:hypothetical protein